MTSASRERQPTLNASEGLPSKLWSHSLKRVLLVFAACVFMGLATNILVAWAIAVWVPYPDPRIWDNPTSGPVASITGIPADWPVTDHIARRNAIGRTEWQFMQRDDPITKKPPPDYTVLHLYRVGWPLESLESQTASRHAFGRLPNSTWSPAIRIPSALRPEWLTRSGREYQDELPLRPIWPAFALNTLFYSTVVWVLVIAFYSIRRVRRRLGSRCASCGYPISGLTLCPECGTLAPTSTPRLSTSKITQPPSPDPTAP